MLIDSNPTVLQSFRTIVLPGAIALLLVSTLAPTRASAALDHYYDFESAEFPMNCSGNCPTISTDYAREGTRSMRSYVNRLTSETSYRTEAVIPGDVKKMTFDRDYWIGFSTLLPPGWTHSGGIGMMAQIHHTNDPGESGGAPPFALRAGSGNWNILSRGENVSMATYTLNSAYEDVGRWVDWVIHYRPSKTSNGVLKVWKDGALVVNQTNRSTTFDDQIGPYWKMGIYEAWKDPNCCNDVPPEKIVYHDALRIASGPGAGYEYVAPRSKTTLERSTGREPQEPTNAVPRSDPGPVPEPTSEPGQ